MLVHLSTIRCVGLGTEEETLKYSYGQTLSLRQTTSTSAKRTEHIAYILAISLGCKFS